MSQSQKRVIVVGPWGGPGGSSWDMGNISPSTRLTKIVLQHRPDFIVSIAFGYDTNGLQQWFEQKGGAREGLNGREVTSEIVLEPEEFITSIRGHWIGNARYISSLTFVTNVHQHGPYGTERGTPFSFVVPIGKIIGFHGRAGWYIDAIGIYVVSN